MGIDYFIDYAVEEWIKPHHLANLENKPELIRLPVPELKSIQLKTIVRTLVMKRLHAIVFG